MVPLDLICFIDPIQCLRDLAQIILQADIFDQLISIFMLVDRLNLLLNRLKQVDHPAVHAITLPLFLVLLSQLLHVDSKTVLFWVAAIKEQFTDGSLLISAASMLILRGF